MEGGAPAAGELTKVFFAFLKATYKPARHYVLWAIPFVVLYSIHFFAPGISPWIPTSAWFVTWIPILFFDYKYTEKIMRQKGLA
jgi:hypothetical protein